MSLSFVCACGKHYVVGDELSGKVVRCKQCGNTTRIPSAKKPPPPPELDIYGLLTMPVRWQRVSRRR